MYTFHIQIFTSYKPLNNTTFTIYYMLNGSHEETPLYIQYDVNNNSGIPTKILDC